MEQSINTDAKLKSLVFSAWARLLRDKEMITREEYEMIFKKCKKMAK